jgi:hypothetical protein
MWRVKEGTTPMTLPRLSARTDRPLGLPLPSNAGELQALRAAAERLKAMTARLRPHEMIAILASHYAKARTRQQPRVAVSLQVLMPDGRDAVILSRG